MRGSPIRKLKKDYEYLLGRTWDLFIIGKSKEDKLETAVANAWYKFNKISKMDNINDAKVEAMQMRDLMHEVLCDHRSEDKINEF